MSLICTKYSWQSISMVEIYSKQKWLVARDNQEYLKESKLQHQDQLKGSNLITSNISNKLFMLIKSISKLWWQQSINHKYKEFSLITGKLHFGQ